MQTTLISPKVHASLNDMVQQWKLARISLLAAIQHYESASISLVDFCTRSKTFAMDRQTHQSLLTNISDEVQTLGNAQATLETSRRRMLRLKNLHIHINCLLPEILVDIFHIVLQTGSSETGGETLPERAVHPRAYSALLCVCSYWRNIMIETPQLWTRISYSDALDGSLERAWLWVQRTNNAPLHVQIETNKLATYRSNRNIEEGVLSMLTTCAKNIRSLTLSVKPTIDLGRTIGCWLSNGQPGSVVELSVQDLTRSNTSPFLQQDISLLNEFLHPLQKLCLVNADLDWKHTRLPELVDLRLEFSDPPSIHDFTSMLSSTPKLRILKLEQKPPISPVHSAAVIPVKLEHLTTINISVALRGFLKDLLQAITPGSNEISLWITEEPDLLLGDDWPQLFKAINCFIRKCNVTAFSVWKGMTLSELHESLASSPNLKTLVLRNWCFDDTAWQAIVRQDIDLEFPKLQTLVLGRCMIPISLDFRELARRHPTIQQLDLVYCRIVEHQADLFIESARDLEPSTDLFRSFSKVIRDVRCFGPYSHEIFDRSCLGFV